MAVIGNSRPLTLIFQPSLNGRGKSGFFSRRLRIAAWARAKQSREPKTYNAPKSAKKLALILDNIGVRIARDAFGYAMHAGRKTVKDRDIKIAARKIFSTKG